jgi:two-component system sensor histidine kinase MprB
LTLQSRFTLVAAGAVAAVALAITAVAFVAIRTDLQNQVRQEVAARADSVEHLAKQYHGHIPDHWVPLHSSGFGVITQVITSAGVVWAPRNDAGLLTPSAAAIGVAAGQVLPFYATSEVSGTRSMVLTTNLAPGLALQVAEPLTSTDMEVTSVGATLATLSAIGVLAATGLGWAVAKTGLAPVGRLARVAEEVSLTGDPGRRVEVAGGRDELGRLATTFNAMLSALQRSLDAQRRLVSDASHELRTPLASLRLNVDVLTENPDLPAAERKEVLARVTDQVAELGRLVASVTDLARGEPPVADVVAVRLNAVAAEALDAARRDWPRTRFDAFLDGGMIDGSADRLRVAFKNLLDNAAKFGPPEGPIEVRLRGGEFTVRDYGPGVADEDLPFIFDRFYRALSSRSAPGSGLGLAVVREIVAWHGGAVTAERGPAGGTVMRLRLPVTSLGRLPGQAGYLASGHFGRGANLVRVKKDQMTWAAAGTLPGGRGKACTPPDHTADPRRVPPAHPDHVVKVISPEWVAVLAAGHFSAAWSWATRVVTGTSVVLPLSPGLYGTSGSFTDASCTRSTG